MSSIENKPARSRLARPWWLGVSVFALGVIWLHGAGSIASTTSYIGLGPAAMVETVGAGLTVLGALLTIQALRGIPFSPQEEEGTDAEAPPSRAAFLIALAGVMVPLLTIRSLGFPITAMLSFALVTHAFGSRRTVFDLVIGAVIGTVAWYGFSLLGIGLGTFLPFIG